MSQYYAKAYDMKVIITRMFSHEGARRGKEFAVSSFAYQIAKGEREPYKDKLHQSGWLDKETGNVDWQWI